MTTQLTMSPDLSTYEIPKKLREKLNRFDQLVSYAALSGKSIPHLRLARPDWVALDDVIRRQSDGEHNASTAVYRGYPIVSA